MAEAPTIEGKISIYPNALASMFYGCSKIKSVTVTFNQYGNLNLNNWLYGVAASGTFYCPYGLDTSIRDSSHIPVGWNVVYTDVPESVLSGISATESALTMN